MKYLKHTLTILFTLLILGNFLTSCSESTGPDDGGLPGTWQLTKMMIQVGILPAISYDPEEIDLSITVVIREDNTFSFSENDEGEIINTSGTWTADENTITIVEGEFSEEIDYDLDGNKLYFYYTEDDDVTLNITQVFTRQ